MDSPPVYFCVGCGRRRVPAKWMYCRICHNRLARGEQTMQDDYPTAEECWRAIRLLAQPRRRDPRS